ncbi:uncharacterized protein UTRI_01142 [Ustilago trichophora]|uniref:Tc1-like transposase DDE domain-containing protein n=1 Tax=Ustilago trichophora TaxID=86804 RepID=A0A5C3DVH4_9BASI|nr:uncharacterized protein UTRI_01142 [Ustilago trichophora]
MPPKKKKNVVPDPIQAKIVDFVLHKGQTKAEVSKRYNYAYSTVDSIVWKYEQTGETLVQRKKGGAFRGSKVGKDHLNTMLEFVGQHPSATIEEIRHHLQDPEVITAQQAWVWPFRTSGHTLDDAVFLDEAGFHLQQTRKVGRARVGERATQCNRPYNRGPNMSLLVAIDCNGIQARRVKTGAWNSASLVEFFQEEVFLVFEGQPTVFVLDNAGFHHSNNSLSTITPEAAWGWIHKTNWWMIVAEAGHRLDTDHDAAAALSHHNLMPNTNVLDLAII